MHKIAYKDVSSSGSSADNMQCLQLKNGLKMSKTGPKPYLILVKNQTKTGPDGTSSWTSSKKIRPNPDFCREHALTPSKMRSLRY